MYLQPKYSYAYKAAVLIIDLKEFPTLYCIQRILKTRMPIYWIYIVGFITFFFLPHRVACRILVPRPGIEPVSPAMEAQSPNHWTSREFPDLSLLVSSKLDFLSQRASISPFVLLLTKKKNSILFIDSFTYSDIY